MSAMHTKHSDKRSYFTHIHHGVLAAGYFAIIRLTTALHHIYNTNYKNCPTHTDKFIISILNGSQINIVDKT